MKTQPQEQLKPAEIDIAKINSTSGGDPGAIGINAFKQKIRVPRKLVL